MNCHQLHKIAVDEFLIRFQGSVIKNQIKIAGKEHGNFNLRDIINDYGAVLFCKERPLPSFITYSSSANTPPLSSATAYQLPASVLLILQQLHGIMSTIRALTFSLILMLVCLQKDGKQCCDVTKLDFFCDTPILGIYICSKGALKEVLVSEAQSQYHIISTLWKQYQ